MFQAYQLFCLNMYLLEIGHRSVNRSTGAINGKRRMYRWKRYTETSGLRHHGNEALQDIRQTLFLTYQSQVAIHPSFYGEI